MVGGGMRWDYKGIGEAVVVVVVLGSQQQYLSHTN